MLLVKTKIGPSKIHGTGLFAAEFIPKGTHVWKFSPGLDLELPREEIMRLSEPSRQQFLNYCYIDYERPDKFVLCFDDARFINHSDNPNLGWIPDENGIPIDVAVSDISIGEEITYDYKKEDADFYRKFGVEKSAALSAS